MAAFYWILDSTIHKFFYKEAHFEFIPSEFNELWMRIVIIVLVIVLGCYADYHTKKIVANEEEKIRIYRASLSATHHIINNFLNKMLLFKLEARKSQDFDKEILSLYDRVIEESQTQIKMMENIEEISEESINKAIRPK